MLECIDDINSSYYNQVILRDEVEAVDWESSEKMYFADIWYEQGVIIDHNTNPIVKGAGSCIFLHNWSLPDETSAGCTEMEPANLTKIINWLDSSVNPVIVQLTLQLYGEYQQTWGLPKTKINIE
jgi:D-alanyl-D-alanine dipeptidase